MDTFKVTMNLCSPLVTQGGYMTLDALLAALIFEATGDLQKAHHENHSSKRRASGMAVQPT